jgi:hypothetical protein
MPKSNSQQNESVHPYRDIAEILKRYWYAYGGWKEVLRSPYAHVAVVLTALSFGFWYSQAWYNTAISVLPNLLGFGVTGYAIWIGWGDEKFRETLIDLDTKPGVSAYVEVSATFAHFAIVQIIALTVAILYSALNFVLDPMSILARGMSAIGLPTNAFSQIAPLGSALGFFFFIYAIFSALEATLALFRLATWFQKMRKS